MALSRGSRTRGWGVRALNILGPSLGKALRSHQVVIESHVGMFLFARASGEGGGGERSSDAIALCSQVCCMLGEAGDPFAHCSHSDTIACLCVFFDPRLEFRRIDVIAVCSHVCNMLGEGGSDAFAHRKYIGTNRLPHNLWDSLCVLTIAIDSLHTIAIGSLHVW